MPIHTKILLLWLWCVAHCCNCQLPMAKIPIWRTEPWRSGLVRSVKEENVRTRQESEHSRQSFLQRMNCLWQLSLCLSVFLFEDHFNGGTLPTASSFQYTDIRVQSPDILAGIGKQILCHVLVWIPNWTLTTTALYNPPYVMLVHFVFK